MSLTRHQPVSKAFKLDTGLISAPEGPTKLPVNGCMVGASTRLVNGDTDSGHLSLCCCCCPFKVHCRLGALSPVQWSLSLSSWFDIAQLSVQPAETEPVHRRRRAVARLLLVAPCLASQLPSLPRARALQIGVLTSIHQVITCLACLVGSLSRLSARVCERV